MDFLTGCFEQHDGVFIDHLQVAGFSTEQARQFMAEAKSCFTDRARGKGAGQVGLQLAVHGLARFIGPRHLDAIAANLGMDTALVRKGLAAITPVLTQAIVRKADRLSETASSMAPGLFSRIG